MKKTLLSLVVLVQIAMFFAKPISIDQSETVGLNWCKQWNFPNSGIASIDIITNKDKTSCIYLLHLKPSGFIFISGDDKVKPIMGYNLNLNINKSKLNYQINDMIDRWLKKIDEINSNSIEATLYNQSWRHLLTDTSTFVPRDNTRDTLIPFNVHWNSGEPYDNQTPVQSGEHVYPGCATVALSQMLKYWNYPLVGQGTHTNSCELGNYTVNFGQTHYDWYEMPPSLSSGSPQSEINETSKLIYNCGVAINANWGNESEANFSDVLNALEDHFRYNTSAQHITKLLITPWSSWYNSLTTELNAGRPLIYGGVSGNTGHAYIIHGFQTYSDEPAFYINLGWGNEDNCDGYYFLDDGTPIIPNPDFDNLTYYNSPEAIIGIQPLNAQQTIYVESQNPDSGIIINGTGIDLMNNSAGGTTSYERYYNNGATITLTAPQITANKRFIKWAKNDIDYSTSLNISAPLPNNVHLGSAYYKSIYGTPTISVNPTSLNFGNVIVNTNSPLYSYQLSGENLVGGITIQSASGYMISTSQSGTYMNTLNINHANGTVTQTIWVRFQPTNVQSYNYNCSHTSTGASNINVALYGNGVQTILSAPTNLIASPLSSSQIYLSWTDNSINENGFNIERKTGVSGTWYQINSVQANIINYNDTGLNSNTTYYYRVIAFNAQGFSNYSSEAFATTVASVVNAVNPTSITFPASGRTQTVQVTSSGTWYVSTLDTYWLSVSVTSPNTFSVTASANQGSARSGSLLVHFNTGQPVGINIATNQPADTPDHVTIYGNIVNSTGADLPNVTLTFINDTFGNNVDVTTATGDYSEPVDYGWSGRTIPTMPGYTFEPSFRDYTNVTSNLENQNFTGSLIPIPIIPAPPSNLTAVTFSSTQIYLNWADDSNNEDGFKIERRTSTTGSWDQIVTVNSGLSYYLDINLTTNTQYFYRIRAYNSAGNSSYSNEAFATTGSLPSDLVAPTNLIATVNASTQINLTWSDNSINENGFKIERKIGSTGAWSLISTVSAGTVTYLNTNLAFNTSYYYRVRAFNAAGDSDYSNEISASTSLISPPVQTQNWLWASSAGSTENEDGYSIATDNNGNSYVTGCFAGTAYFGTTVLTCSGDDDIFIAKLDSNGNWLWAKKAGGNNSVSGDEGRDISTDDNGNCYVTGCFYQNATFGTITLQSTFGRDIFVTKLDTNGNWIWAVRAGGTGGTDNGLSIATDNSGNSYVTGLFNSIANFGGTSLTCYGERDIFIAKMDTNGNWLWARQAGSTGYDYGQGISLDNSGNCFVTGFYSGTASFGTTTIVNNGGFDIFTTKLDTNGNWLWVKRAGGTDSERGAGIINDNSGNSYVTGYFQGTATFESISIVSSGGMDAFVCKLDSSGNLLWVKRAGGTGDDQGNSIDIDNSGNVYLAGSFYNTANFGTASLISNGSADIFITKLDTNGIWISVTRAGGIGEEIATSISSDNNGNSYVSGKYHSQDGANFGSHSLPILDNADDVFVSKASSLSTLASFSASVTAGSSPLSVQFTDTSQAGNGILTSWLWNFGDGSTSPEQNPSHIYYSRGVYSVTLTIWNSLNMTSTLTIPNMINVTNQVPHVIQEMPDLNLNEDFSTFVINLDNYFVDNDDGLLIYTVEHNPNIISAFVSGNTLIMSSVINQSGTASITITANDMQSRSSSTRNSISRDRATCSDTFSVSILPINDTPVISLPASFSFAEDSNLVINMAQYASDVDNATLTLSAQNSAHISVSINGMNATLTSSANWFGTEQVTFTVNDNVSRESTISKRNGDLSNKSGRLLGNEGATIFSGVKENLKRESRATSSATINIVVTPINDAPVINLPASFTFTEDNTLPINMATYANDVDNTTLILTASGNTNVTIAITGLNVTLGALPNWSGTEQVTFTVNDDMGRAIASDIADIIVTPVNDAPVINLPESLTFLEDSNLVVNMATYVSDVDNTNLTITAQNSAHVSVAINGLNATLTATANWSGTEVIHFTVSDGTLNATGQTNVIVTAVNDAPAINLPTSFTFAEDGSLPIDMASYTSDVDNTNLTLTAGGNTNVTVAITGLNVTLGALLNWSGTEQLTFTVNDNMGRAIASDIADIIVTPVNDAPVINLPVSVTFVEDSNLEVNLSPFVSDVDNTNLTVTAQNTSHITVVMNGLNATITASPNWNGNESVSFTVSDGLLNSTGQVNVIVTPVNDTPIIDLPVSFTYDEDTDLTVNFALYCSDVDNTNLSLSVTGNTNITASITGLSIVFNSPLNWSGSENMIFIVSDGVTRATAIDSALVIVTPISDPPIIVSFLPTQTTISATINETLGFSINATDVDSPMNFSWFVDDVNQNNSTNEFSYQFAQSGTHQVKAVVSDNVSTVEQIWTVSVPVANDDPQVAPLVTRLYANYPNPFNPRTTIRYSAKEPCDVYICVYNIKGNIVKNLIQSKISTGSYTIDWDGTNNAGTQVSSGIYYLYMKTSNYQSCKKMVMLK